MSAAGAAVGDLTPRTFNGKDILRIMTWIGRGDHTVYFELSGNLPLDFFSMLYIEGFGEFYSSEASLTPSDDLTEWSWTTRTIWDVTDGDQRLVVIHP